tara:strand:+ start:483 stop:653 length:171 start_codon:yes stop_codon:yes gene_type:complete
MLDFMTIIIILIFTIIGHILGFWTGVHYEREKLSSEIIDLTSALYEAEQTRGKKDE